VKHVWPALVVLFLLVYILPLGTRPLITPDEMRYCEIPREMIQSGDWIVPHIDGVRYFEKPPLGYWLIAASLRAFGQNAWAARLPSALSVGVSTILVAALAFRFAGGRTAAGLAAVIFLTCFQVYALGTFNVLDSMFSACVTGAVTASYFWLQRTDERPRWPLLVVAGACCGLAFLTKGLLGLVLPALVIIPFAIWDGKWKAVFRAPWLPLLVAVAIGLPWCLAIAKREPDFWHYFLWVEHFQRFFTSKHGERVQPFWYLWVVLLLGTFPWNVLAGAVGVGLRRLGLRDHFLRFLVCWAVVPFVFFELSKGKLGTYILPCYPPIALLIAVGLSRYVETVGQQLIATASAILAGVAVVALALVPVVVLLTTGHLPALATALAALRIPLAAGEPFAPGEVWKAGLGAGCLFAWAALLILAVRTKEPRRQLALYAAGPVLGLILTPVICPASSYQRRMPERFLQSQAARVSPDAILVCDHDMAYASCWLYRRNDVLLLHDAGELEYGLGYADSAGKLLTDRRFIDLVNRHPDGRRVILILPGDTYSRYMGYMRMVGWDKLLPKPRYEAASGGVRLFEF